MNFTKINPDTPIGRLSVSQSKMNAIRDACWREICEAQDFRGSVEQQERIFVALHKIFSRTGNPLHQLLSPETTFRGILEGVEYTANYWRRSDSRTTIIIAIGGHWVYWRKQGDDDDIKPCSKQQQRPWWGRGNPDEIANAASLDKGPLEKLEKLEAEKKQQLLIDCLKKAMKTLPYEGRKAIWLRLGGQSIVEAAKTMEVTTWRVRMLSENGMASLEATIFREGIN